MTGTSIVNKKYKLFGSPLPGSGPLLSFIFSIIDRFKVDNSVVSWHQIIEAFKFAYAERTKLGDPFFTEGVKGVSIVFYTIFLSNFTYCSLDFN